METRGDETLNNRTHAGIREWQSRWHHPRTRGLPPSAPHSRAEYQRVAADVLANGRQHPVIAKDSIEKAALSDRSGTPRFHFDTAGRPPFGADDDAPQRPVGRIARPRTIGELMLRMPLDRIRYHDKLAEPDMRSTPQPEPYTLTERCYPTRPAITVKGQVTRCLPVPQRVPRSFDQEVTGSVPLAAM
jgi:hypothetical protein